MIENYLSVQDTIALCGIVLMVVFVGVKLIQRKETWGWKKRDGR